MTTLHTPDLQTSTPATAAPPAPAAGPSDGAPRSRRARWALWGTAAGVLGAVSTLVADGAGTVYQDGATITPADMERLERVPYHVGVVTGFLTVGALVIFAAAFRRWAARRAPDSLAGRAVPGALLASAGALIIGYGYKGAMAVYLPGGMDDYNFDPESLFPLFMLLDFGPFLGWWGASIAAGLVAWMGLRERVVSRWLGVVSLLFAVAPLAFMVPTGLPGMSLTAILWLIILGLGMALGRSGRATA